MSEYNKALREFRIGHSFLQKEMADKLQISRVYYARLETGKTQVSKKLYYKICSLTCFQAPLPQECKSEQELEMCSLCEKLNEKDMKVIKKTIMKLLKGYKNIHLLILVLLSQLIFNFDFCSDIFL